MNLSCITGGVYLVLDPTIPEDVLLDKLRQSLEGGVEVVQVWDNWPEAFSQKEKTELAKRIKSVATVYQVPVIINEEWEVVVTGNLDGVHFNDIPADYAQIKRGIGREFISGITCGNDLTVVEWANENHLDYISFCAMFPSKSAADCEIIRPITLMDAKKITQLPLFISGGVTVENLQVFKNENREIKIDGIAVISGILDSETPQRCVSEYRQTLKRTE